MNTNIKFFHPFSLLFYSQPNIEDSNWHPSDDSRRYGLSLDLTTEFYFYTYDWGYGLNFRLFGFGFEINRYGF